MPAPRFEIDWRLVADSIDRRSILDRTVDEAVKTEIARLERDCEAVLAAGGLPAIEVRGPGKPLRVIDTEFKWFGPPPDAFVGIDWAKKE